ncbi:MAG: hypothetical protein RL514_3440 [Verrucomicrobiota bacterium]|jgi:hypothetical protein
MNHRFAPEHPLRRSFAKPALALLTAILVWVTSHPAAATGTPTPLPATEVELKALKARAGDARQDVARWLRATPAHDPHLCDKSPNYFSARMEHRLQTVSTAYDEFLGRHPQHLVATAQAAAFRAELADELEIIRRWEAARLEAPDSPAPWTELADELIHCGRTAEGFDCFEKARALAPRVAEYHFDFATALLLYRKDAASHYKLTEPEIFDRVLALYRHGLLLEPEDYSLAARYAETFYLVKPARPAEGRVAWEQALKLAGDDAQRDEARTHLARYAIQAAHLNLARVYLELVDEPRLEPVKQTLLRRIHETEKPTKAAPPLVGE